VAGETEPEPAGGSEHAQAGEGWVGALVRAFVVLVASFLALVIVPNQLLAFLSPRVTPASRDLVVVAWVSVAFVGLCWLFLALQRGRRR
jgi:hypothetical protein